MLRGGLRVAGEGLGLEGLKRLGAALDSGMRLRSTRRPEVVAAVDLCQPGAGTLQVGFGLLDFFVGRPIAVALAAELAEERRDWVEDFAVLIVARGLKLGDDCASSSPSSKVMRSIRAAPPFGRTRSTSRRISRSTSGRAGSTHTDWCRYSAPSERSLRQIATRSESVAPALDAVTSSQDLGRI